MSWVCLLVLAILSCSPPAVETATSPTPTDATTVPNPTDEEPDEEQSEPIDRSSCEQPDDLALLDFSATMEQNFESFVRAYNGGDAQTIASIIGEGTIDDPSLEPEHDRLYNSVAEWLAAAQEAQDQIEIIGLGPDAGVFRYFIERSNPDLIEAGIDRLAITWTFNLTEGCGHLIESSDIVSDPDPCRFEELFDIPTGQPVSSCASGLTPRADHAAVWTGTEVLIVGGTTGVAGLTSGIGYDPVADIWRDLAPIPPEFYLGYSAKALWTGVEMIVVGSSDTTEGLALLAYDPVTDAWSASPPLPGDRTATGGMVWTGTEVILGGGDNLDPDNSAWAYRPDTGQWRQLPESGLPPSEGMEAVWIGDRALFFGGLGLEGQPGAIYDPATDTWQPLPAAPQHWIESHALAWTGEYVIVYSGHTGPAHPTSLLLYHPESNAWSTSAPLPVAPAERLAGAWTGERLILWGGLATYGNAPDDDGDFVFGHGAAYDPATDTWSVLPESPLGDRCDHSGTWTGDVFVIFGGMPLCGEPNIRANADGALYDPVAEAWQMIDGPPRS